MFFEVFKGRLMLYNMNRHCLFMFFRVNGRFGHEHFGHGRFGHWPRTPGHFGHGHFGHGHFGHGQKI